MIDTGAKATVTNLLHPLHPLHPLHRPFFHNKTTPSCPAKMCGATAKDVLIPPIAKGFLRIPAITLPGWTKVECHYIPQFTAILLNEQDLLKATERKSDCSGLTVNKLFDEHPDQLQHAIQKGQPQFEKHLDTDTGRVVVTCHHKHWESGGDMSSQTEPPKRLGTNCWRPDSRGGLHSPTHPTNASAKPSFVNQSNID